MRHGGQILIDQLAAHGVERVFLVPGESFLAALDALHGEVRMKTIICRHESGAAMMAEATGKLTGRPGVAMVTRGPGAANALPGLLIAREDETPMILVVGLPSRALEGRHAFQGLDCDALFSGAAKAILTVRETARIPEATARAVDVARTGRPGPVVLAIPEDVLSATADVSDAAVLDPPRPAPAPAQLAALQDILASAERPMMIVGGPGWSRDVQKDIEAFALRFDLPVAAAFRKQDFLDNRHRCYAGHLGFGIDAKLASGVRAADVIVVAGARLGEITTGAYGLIRSPDPAQHLVMIHPSADAMTEGPRPRMGIVSEISAFASALRTIEPPPSPPWSTFRRDLRAAYEASLRPPASAADDGTLALAHVVAALDTMLPENAIVTNGAGNYAQALHRAFRYKRFGTCLASGYGAMGYGLPAAIAAKLANPSVPVVALAGDGCFMMSASELATAVQYALPLVVLVADNGMLGTIRTHQERAYPGRVSGTTLVNPDFAAFARSFGAMGETVTRSAEVRPALARALAAGRPALIHLILPTAKTNEV